MEKNENICCPQFNPELWDGKVFDWSNKRFIKDRVRTFFYMPLNFGGVIKRMMEKIEKSSANSPDWMGLSDHTSKWNMDLYVAVDKEVADAENTSFSGKFISKVYEGDFRETGKWGDDFKNYAKEKGFEMKKMYMWYTTCPKCAKKYGKNYVVFIAEVK